MSIYFLAAAAGALAGGLNYALLASGCKRVLKIKRGHGVLWILAGVLAPVAGMGLLAALAPQLLVWFGCAAAGALVAIAVARAAIQLTMDNEQ